MTEFEDALRARLASNAALADARRQAENEIDRAAAQAQADAERRAREQRAAQAARHAELATHLQQLIESLVAAGDESFIVRSGWTASGEELLARLATRGIRPARSLSLELDRDDDEVLARWHSDLGEAIEIWHLLEFTPAMLTDLVLQVVDHQLWVDRATTPPFPGNPD